MQPGRAKRVLSRRYLRCGDDLHRYTPLEKPMLDRPDTQTDPRWRNKDLLPELVREKLVLIVEPDPGLRRLLSYRISNRYAVVTASSGEQALPMMGAYQPCLVIAASTLPKMDAIALMEEVRRQERNASPRFIIVGPRGAQPAAALAAGASGYLYKPVDFQHLMSLLACLMLQADYGV